MKDYEVLQKAKKYLWDGKVDLKNQPIFICLAIARSTKNASQRNRLCCHIETLLDGETTYENWMDIYHNDLFDWRDYTDIVPREIRIKLQEARIAWLDSLIEEYKELDKK